MVYYDTKQAAVDPDNPAANEQIPYAEWNAMVSDIRRKIHEITVDITALGNDKVLVYKTASSSFVMESPTAVAALVDLTDVTISGVPSDNEVLAYDSASSDWINQTAAEAGLATVAGLAAYLPLAGGTMAGTLNMGDHLIDDVDNIQAYDVDGIRFLTSAGYTRIDLASTTYSFEAGADASMNGYLLHGVGTPTSSDHASNKGYDDAHLFAKEAVTSFLDGYIPVYRTSSGKFEMEEGGGGSAGFPVVDSTAIVKGSADGTKLMRFEVDGITTGTTRVMTVPDKNITLCDTAEVMLLSGVYAMVADIDMGGHYIDNCGSVTGRSDSESLDMVGGLSTGKGGRIVLNGDGVILYPGRITLSTPNAAKTDVVDVAYCEGVSDTPLLGVKHGLDMNDMVITDMKNSASSALYGTQRDIEIDIGGTPYYFTVYPSKT